MLGRTVTPDNAVLRQMFLSTQQFVQLHGASVDQAQALATAMLQHHLGLTAATMAVDDVFRVAALITLLAVVPALFLRTQKPAGAPAPTPVVE